MNEELLICFTRMNPPYLAGERATFDSAYALKLATEGVAVLLDPPVGFDQHGQRETEELIGGFALADFDLSAGLELKHVGGGRYDVAGVRVKGKAKAKAIAKALADLPAPAPEGEGD